MSAWVDDPSAGARKSWRIARNVMGLPSAGQVRTDIGTEGGHLIAQLGGGPGREAQLQVRHAHRAVLVEGVDDPLGRTRPRVLRQLPAGVADVDHLRDDTDVERGPWTHTVPFLRDERDGRGHLLLRRALGDPAVAAGGHPAERGLRRAADPDRRPRPRGRPGTEPDVADPLVGPRLEDAVDRGIGDAPAFRERDAERGELALDVPGADSEDDAPAGEVVEGPE